ncbi:MAG: methyltransferase [Rhodospirillales bacterium RIFCSPLOWO2_12_FULL_58_28]|nr:MAG: methyltransferase [Rhodospirillales bacterium RIFCSPLOWO2_02_FULL_58_16]OHC78333.1 MAG: methyltransferase [Rhodospirillales bacterium RIFCSPLOWO2_12_FULL_58_28]
MRTCRLCGSESLTGFLDLGFTPLADDFLKPERLHEPEVHYPLRVVRCDHCMFVQLDHVVDAGILYGNDYPYMSSITAAGRKHFHAFAAGVTEAFAFPANSLAVDIGSNVGVLLDGFKRCGMRIVGIEPAGNIATIARENGIPTISEFFSPAVAERVVAEHGKAKVITGSNVFAHVDDLKTFLTAIDGLLDADGVFIVEAPYLMHLIDKLEYDTIYHEHLSYLSLTPIVPFLRRCGMEAFDVTQTDIHGGSIRIFISRPGQRKVTDTVRALLDMEQKREIHAVANLAAFAEKVRKHRDKLNHLLMSLKREGKRIAGVSAPAKGMTLLNYCKIDGGALEFLTEKCPLKIGRFAPGSHLPVLPDSALMTENIDYALILAWNFKDEIMANLSAFKSKGGRFIIPIPEPMIV